ncbi:hypothetical protein EMIT0P44_350031 [Pseudomonas sp. IT-P44]|jgi:hypothetical protein
MTPYCRSRLAGDGGLENDAFFKALIAGKPAPTGQSSSFPTPTKKPLNLSIQRLFDLAVWLSTWTRIDV